MNIASQCGVSQNFMSFIEGLGIPCSPSTQPRMEETPSKKRILSATQRNEPILVLNSEVVPRSSNNSTALQSNRNSKLAQPAADTAQPLTQHFLSNLGSGSLLPHQSPRTRPP